MEREIRGKEKSGEEGKRKKEERREREGGGRGKERKEEKLCTWHSQEWVYGLLSTPQTAPLFLSHFSQVPMSILQLDATWVPVAHSAASQSPTAPCIDTSLDNTTGATSAVG